MEVIESKIPGVIIFQNEVYVDERGTFEETYSKNKLDRFGLDLDFVQDNRSKSLKKNTLRGLHLQEPPFDQGKLVRCEKGAVFDVAVDLRMNSETYGLWVGVELAEGDGKQFFVPSGFAHGFLTLEDHTVFTYKCSNYYHPQSEKALLWNDPELGIDWPLSGEPILSFKDSQAPLLRNFETPFR